MRVRVFCGGRGIFRKWSSNIRESGAAWKGDQSFLSCMEGNEPLMIRWFSGLNIVLHFLHTGALGEHRVDGVGLIPFVFDCVGFNRFFMSHICFMS